MNFLTAGGKILVLGSSGVVSRRWYRHTQSPDAGALDEFTETQRRLKAHRPSDNERRSSTIISEMSPPDLTEAISAFGSTVRPRFEAGVGEPEDQLRGPFEVLLDALATIVGIKSLVLTGETHLAEEHIRPDYAAHVGGALIGFIEVKAPGKGADPSAFRDRHDKKQWQRLACLPNVLYTDGQSFGLYRFGERVGRVVKLVGNVETAGSALSVKGDALLGIVGDFLQWSPLPPRKVKDLAVTTARLCRLLRDEVSELLATDIGLRALAADWRDLLFPQATDAEFADGYAQTVTFALLLARVERIDFGDGDLRQIAGGLNQRHTLIGTALDVLTNPTVLGKLAVAANTLVRVLGVVDWMTVSKGETEAWLHFYEEFLQEYDPNLRRQTGSYYTPFGVVDPMVRLVDELLKDRFGRPSGFASPDVTVVDPGCGTGTFLFRVIDQIARTVEDEEGPGAVAARLEQATKRLIGFELQAGPFAVAELRLVEELRRLGARPSPGDLRVYVANALDDPFIAETHLAAVYEPIAQSRRHANEVKKNEPVLVVIGNPPYREKSRGRGGWIEAGNPDAEQRAPLADFMPQKEWGLGTHARHLYNLYVYFWRWATWKVFEHHPESDQGIVAYITAAGFVSGPGFAGMRSYLRHMADEVWVIDLSPEGHQPDVNTRVFQGVQQPICITIAMRAGLTDASTPAVVHHRSIHGLRDQKFEDLRDLHLDDQNWTECATEWAAPFLPPSGPAWSQHPALDELLAWSGTGTMIGRAWVRNPSPEILRDRWSRLVGATGDEQRAMLVEHPRDRKIETVVADGLPGYSRPKGPIASEAGEMVAPTRVAFRSFDRQWLIPDKRLINQPNPSLWSVRDAPGQVFLTALHDRAPTTGPAATFSELVPDVHHYHGRGGRTWPLWLDPAGEVANVLPGLLQFLENEYQGPIGPLDLMAYIAAVTSHSGYTRRFGSDLTMPGLRIPLTRDRQLFDRAVGIGQRVIWLHTQGNRCADPDNGRPRGRPRLPTEERPKVTRSIPSGEGSMPVYIDYDPKGQELLVGRGVISPVAEAVWDYSVSGMPVVRKWFGYRKQEPEGRSSSPLDAVVAVAWDSTWTTELVELLNVLGLAVAMEPDQGALLVDVLAGPMITTEAMTEAGVLPASDRPRPILTRPRSDAEPSLLDDLH